MTGLLIAIGGFSGSGKSAVAQALAVRHRVIVVEIDLLWKKELGLDAHTSAPPGSYNSPERRNRVLAEYDRLCLESLRAGKTVIAQKVFARQSERMAIEDIAQEAQAGFLGVWLDAPVNVLKARVRERVGSVSDAPEAAVDRQAAIESGEMVWTKLDAARDLEMVIRDVAAMLPRQSP